MEPEPPLISISASPSGAVIAVAAWYWATLNAANTRPAARGLILLAATSVRACACQPTLDGATGSTSIAALGVGGGAVVWSEQAVETNAPNVRLEAPNNRIRDMASSEAIEELIAEVPNRSRLLAAFAGDMGMR